MSVRRHFLIRSYLFNEWKKISEIFSEKEKPLNNIWTFDRL